MQGQRATVNATVVDGSIPTWKNEICNIFIQHAILSFSRSDNKAKRGVEFHHSKRFENSAESRDRKCLNGSGGINHKVSFTLQNA